MFVAPQVPAKNENIKNLPAFILKRLLAGAIIILAGIVFTLHLNT